MQSLGRTLRRWLAHITAWHEARVTKGPTEAINNLIKRIKRIGFGFRRLDGLPIGMHFLGRFGDEATLLRLAAQLEQARPWASKRPPTLASMDPVVR